MTYDTCKQCNKPFFQKYPKRPQACCTTECRKARSRQLYRESVSRLDADPKVICSVSGCAERATRRGWCGKHYTRWQKYGRADAPVLEVCKNTCCVVDGCGQKATRKHLCGKHYSAARNLSDNSPEGIAKAERRRAKAKEQAKRCEIIGCQKLAYKSRLCSMHRCRLQNNGHPERIRFFLNQCHGCGKIYASVKIGKSCSLQCQYYVHRGETVWRECECCKTIFRAANTRQYCSPQCRRALRLARQREWVHQQKQTNPLYLTRHRMVQSKRRARIVKNGPPEEFTFEEICERDQWSCYLCGKPVDKELDWPHTESASMDHVVPLSKGGPHVRDNVRLTHLWCNLSKNAKEVRECRRLEERDALVSV